MNAEPRPLPSAAPSAPRARRRGWFWIALKWVRIVVLLLVLVVIVLGLFLHHVGLPEWVKERFTARLRAQGWHVEFSRLRLRWYHGVVAEHVVLQRTNGAAGPSLFLEQAQFRPRFDALRRFDLAAQSVTVNAGRLLLPLRVTNGPPRTLLLDGLDGELVFHPDDLWELRSLEARCLGVRVRARGLVTNASHLREWRFPERAPREPRPPPRAGRLLELARQVKFAGPGELSGILHLDAANPRRLQASLKLMTDGLASPWGGGSNVHATVDWQPAEETSARGELRLQAGPVWTPGGTAGSLDVRVDAASFLGRWPTTTEARPPPGSLAHEPPLRRSGITATLLHAAGRDWEAREASLQLDLRHGPADWLPADVAGELALPRRARAHGATSDWTRVTFQVALPSWPQWKLGDTNLDWPERLAGLTFHGEGAATNLAARGAVAAHAGVSAVWREGVAGARGHAAMLGGLGHAAVEFDTRAREFRFALTNHLRPHALRPLLPTNAHAALDGLDPDTPALFEGRGRLDWPAVVPPASNRLELAVATLSGAGRLRMGAGAWRAIPFDRLDVPFTVTNAVWQTDSLVLSRPEGAVEAALTANARTADFHGRLASGIDLASLRTVVPGKTAQGAFRIVEMRAPPSLEASILGNWRDWQRLGVDVRVRGTNFSIHDQPALDCAGRVLYTNRFLSLLDVEVRREQGEHGRAEGIGIDLRSQRLYLTNAAGRLDAQAVARAVGPVPGRFLEAYRFDAPPSARVWGVIPLRSADRGVDAHFELAGGPFHWRQFRLDRIQGRVDWVTNTLALTNVTGEMEGGPLRGGAWFEFLPEGGSQFAFHVALTNAPLKSLASGLAGGKTNRLEGALAGELVVTRALDRDPLSWQGQGHVQLRNGVIWDIPVFGVFSPVLNAVVPGLGNSRAREAAAAFVITNSVIHTGGLEINATGMRMNYQGSVNFDQHVDGRMEAELLRNVPAIGVVISKLFWPVTKLFEYRVTGTLGQPKTEPLFIIPKLLLMPLTPFKSLKELFGGEDRTPPAPPPKAPEGKPE